MKKVPHSTHAFQLPCFSLALALFGLSLSVATSLAAVTPNALFSDHAVIQRGVDVPVWGAAKDGEKVEVTFAGQTVSTTAKDGKWMVRLKPIAAGGPFEMDMKGENSVVVHDVLVGEVWICSGQSNMERQLGPRPPQPLIEDWEKHVAAADHPQIRCLTVEHRRAQQPLDDVKGAWVVCSPQTVADFTAVGYFFGRDLHAAMKVPVGLIHTSLGGTVAQDWMSRQGLEAHPELRRLIAAHERAAEAYPARLEAYQKEEAALMANYQAEAEKAKKAGKLAPRPPAPPPNPAGGGPATLYNAMIAPIVPCAMRGVIWYQGESNNGEPALYRTLFPALIADWRQAWGEGDFPFLFVQIAPQPSMSPELREAQLLTWKKTPATAMVVITDHGSENIHPPQKEPVGARLALAARAVAYGEKIEYSGPLYDALKIDGNRAVVSFTHVDSGLVARGGALRGFTIAGEDRKFVPAAAAIEGDTVVVSAGSVQAPVAVRFGWANMPDGNLFNKVDLPASPFRTDDWPAGR